MSLIVVLEASGTAHPIMRESLALSMSQPARLPFSRHPLALHGGESGSARRWYVYRQKTAVNGFLSETPNDHHRGRSWGISDFTEVSWRQS